MLDRLLEKALDRLLDIELDSLLAMKCALEIVMVLEKVLGFWLVLD